MQSPVHELGRLGQPKMLSPLNLVITRGGTLQQGCGQDNFKEISAV